VGGSVKNVDALFKEAKKMDAILVFDQASVLFSAAMPSSQVPHHTARSHIERWHAALNATAHWTQAALNERNSVLYQMNKFPGVVVLICDQVEVRAFSAFCQT
jgi:arginine/lysine/ornithine decarboxylase